MCRTCQCYHIEVERIQGSGMRPAQLCLILCWAPCRKLDLAWVEIVCNHLRAAQQRAEGNPSQAFQLYTAQGQKTNSKFIWQQCPAVAQPGCSCSSELG